MSYVKVNDVDIYYEVHDEEDPVVFIHGIAITSQVWEFQKAVIEEKFKMIIYDLGGTGKSGKTPQLFSRIVLDFLEGKEIKLN